MLATPTQIFQRFISHAKRNDPGKTQAAQNTDLTNERGVGSLEPFLLSPVRPRRRAPGSAARWTENAARFSARRLPDGLKAIDVACAKNLICRGASN
jgi:hypothetical protein